MDPILDALNEQLMELVLLAIAAVGAYATRQLTPLVTDGVGSLRNMGLIQQGDDLDTVISNAVWAVEEGAERLGLAGKAREKFNYVKAQAGQYARDHDIPIKDSDIERMIDAAVREMKSAGGELKAAASKTDD